MLYIQYLLRAKMELFCISEGFNNQLLRHGVCYRHGSRKIWILKDDDKPSCQKPWQRRKRCKQQQLKMHKTLYVTNRNTHKNLLHFDQNSRRWRMHQLISNPISLRELLYVLFPYPKRSSVKKVTHQHKEDEDSDLDLNSSGTIMSQHQSKGKV